MTTILRSLTQVLRPLPYFGAYMLGIGVLYGYARGGLWPLQPAVWVFLIVPGIDLWLTDWESHQSVDVKDTVPFRLVLWLWVPLQLGLLWWGLWEVVPHAGAWLLAGVTFSMGITTGVVG